MLDTTHIFPITLVNEELNIKVTVMWDSEISRYLIDINGIPFESYVFMDPASRK